MIGAIVLTVIGLGFVLAEVFFPSLGLFTLIAGALLISADVMAFDQGAGIGTTFIVLQVVLIPLLVWGGLKALPRLSFGKRMMLSGPATQPGAGLPALDHLAGRRGLALTALRPGGMARFDAERVSVVALGGVIEKDTEIVVVAVEGAEVRVRPVAAPDTPAERASDDT